MGGDPYWYFVPYQPDAQTSLDALRQQEFLAGRYYPVLASIDFDDPNLSAVRPGPQHTSIEEAVEVAAETGNGTRSILDIAAVGAEPDFGVAGLLADEVLLDLYGTAKPTREMIAEKMAFLAEIERGQGAYFVVYRDGEPVEYCFAGFSYD